MFTFTVIKSMFIGHKLPCFPLHDNCMIGYLSLLLLAAPSRGRHFGSSISRYAWHPPLSHQPILHYMNLLWGLPLTPALLLFLLFNCLWTCLPSSASSSTVSTSFHGSHYWLSACLIRCIFYTGIPSWHNLLLSFSLGTETRSTGL